MAEVDDSGLTAVQKVVLACVATSPGQFNRSALAKLLAGSMSSRLPESARTHPYYGRLARKKRKQITFDIDVLRQQGHLTVDGYGRLRPAPSE